MKDSGGPDTAPGDPEALRVRAAMAAGGAVPTPAERRLRSAVEAAPAHAPAYADLASFLCREARAGEALALLDRAIEAHPDKAWPLSLKAGILTVERRVGETLDLHRHIIARAPAQAVPWMNYAHALQVVGRIREAEAAYRKCLRLDGSKGPGWLGLARLRDIRFTHKDVADMERAVERTTDPFDQAQIHFALGQALADQGAFEGSFLHYGRGNAARAKVVPYDPTALTKQVDRLGDSFKLGPSAPGIGRQGGEAMPIFIVGMPRSGSTLVEQILASHPMIEGLGELFELGTLAAQLEPADRDVSWITRAVAMSEQERADLGAQYLASVGRYRRSGRPFFTDKMPQNWQLIGLVALLLPDAKIVEVRRDAIACCFSNYTTCFSRHTSVPTSLEDWGSAYRDYIRGMDIYQACLPGKIHKVGYERLVGDPDAEIRRLLDYLGLPFDAACLCFHENERAVDTPSAQQVRRPLTRTGIDRWRAYEPFLQTLMQDICSDSCT